MSTQTVNILALVLGFLGVIVVLVAILVQVYLSKWTDKMIEKEDERAKRMRMETQRMIDEGNKRLERILLEIDKSTKEILAEILKKVST